MTERGLPSTDGASACPFVAFEDDREGRSTSPDHRHRCFAESPPAPRALAHQEAYCLSSAFPVCPVFQDWARRGAAHARGTGERAETPPTATAGPAAVAGAAAVGAAAVSGGLDGESDFEVGSRDAELDDRRDDPRRARSDPSDLPVRRNPPRDWAAPPPWATGAGGHPGTGRSGEPSAADLLANRSVEGRGLAGSAADRLAGGPPPAPNPAAGLAASAAAASAAVGSPAAWSASAAGSASAAPDDELADLVRGRSSVPPLHVDADDRPTLPPTRPEDDARSLPPRTGRRPSVSSTRQPGPEIPGPAWERMRRYEAYPTIRSRGLPGIPGLSRVALLAGTVAIAAIALFMLPALLGIGVGPASSLRPSGSGAGGGAIASASVEPTTSPAPSAQVYIVKSGDTMSKIAAKYGLKPEDLCAANAATVKNCDKIALGQELIIPAPGSGIVAGPSGSAAP